MKYLVYTLIQILALLVLANVCLAFVPKPIRKAIECTFKLASRLIRFVLNLSNVIVKKVIANYKEIEQPTKKKSTTKKTKSNVIQFPKSKIQ
jgi:hypothetical protein